uniref:Uncharacterized protein n=1 Tax=viral metagenome TaxID=1070528 RepID=A0A6M3LHQ2_9ZZZZ
MGSEKREYPDIATCVVFIAATLGKEVRIVAKALLAQSNELGIDAEELVHTQYDAAQKNIRDY